MPGNNLMFSVAQGLYVAAGLTRTVPVVQVIAKFGKSIVLSTSVNSNVILGMQRLVKN